MAPAWKLSLQEAAGPVPGAASDPEPTSAWLSEEGIGTLALGHVAMLAARRDPAALLGHSAALKKRFKTVRSRPKPVQARERYMRPPHFHANCSPFLP